MPRQLWAYDQLFSNKVCVQLQGPRGNPMYFAEGYKSSGRSFWCPPLCLLDTYVQQCFHPPGCQPDALEKPLWQNSLGGTCYFWRLPSFPGMVLELNYEAWISVRPCSICYCTWFFPRPREETVSISFFQFLFGGRLDKGLNCCLVNAFALVGAFLSSAQNGCHRRWDLLSLFCQCLTLHAFFL